MEHVPCMEKEKESICNCGNVMETWWQYDDKNMKNVGVNCQPVFHDSFLGYRGIVLPFLVTKNIMISLANIGFQITNLGDNTPGDPGDLGI